MNSLRLFKVTLKGVHGTTGTDYHTSFVVAQDPTEAYQRVRSFLDENDLGFVDQREMDRIELIAESKRYPECKTILFLPEALQ